MTNVKKILKVLARSRSIKFTRDYLSTIPSDEISAYRWKGRDVHYRPGTSDPALIYEILLKGSEKSEYKLPKEFEFELGSVKSVLDIGSNIGTASVFLADIFPNATIHAFEPSPANFRVLEKNAADSGKILCHPYALGDSDGAITLFESDVSQNFGGFSAYAEGVNPGRKISVPVRRTDAALKEIGVSSIDVIKIDTEGAEWEILSSINLDMLRNVKLIMGELHGRRDFELLSYLQPYFHIGLHKNMMSRLFNFYAIRR